MDGAEAMDIVADVVVDGALLKPGYTNFGGWTEVGGTDQSVEIVFAPNLGDIGDGEVCPVGDGAAGWLRYEYDVGTAAENGLGGLIVGPASIPEYRLGEPNEGLEPLALPAGDKGLDTLVSDTVGAW